jgi:formylglycine-generating enzyme required for sulfatase activity
MKQRLTFLVSLFLLLSTFTVHAAEVKNVSSKQVGNRVQITYDLTGDENEAEVAVTVKVGGKDYKASELNLEGDLGKLRPGNKKTIWWNVLRDFPRGLDQNVVFDVSAGGGKIFVSPTLGAKFILLPVGTFMMGSPADEPRRSSDETQHRVTLTKPFYLQTTEVTQGQWKAVMGTNPSHFSSCGDNCPVEKVSWDDVQEFIRKLNQREGTNKYRLPTEAEWEYAARAGTQTALYNGPLKIISDNNGPALDAIAWYGGNSGVNYSGGYDCSGWSGKQYSSSSCGTHPVGGKSANAWGLYDMLGNVWEWVQDWRGDYPTGSVTDPQGPSGGSGRVGRVGSWIGRARICRAANRGNYTPGNRVSYLGFRLARTH